MRLGLRACLPVAAAAFLMLGACGEDDATSDAGSVKIGVQGVFSGELASFGDRLKGGVTYALSRSGKAKDVEVVYADDEGTADKAPVAAQQLLDENVDVVVGPAFSSAAGAAIPLFKSARIPTVTPWSGASNLIDLGGEWYFTASTPNACQAEFFVAVAEDRAYERIAVVDDNEAYGADISKSMPAAAEEAGLEITGTYHGAAGMTDWSSIIARLRRDDPDLVVYNGYATEAGRLIQQARDRGFSAPFLGSDGVADPTIFDVADPAKLAGVLALRAIPPELTDEQASGRWRQFRRDYSRFAKKQGLSSTEADVYVALAFDATNLVLDAVDQAGSTDGEAIVDAMRQTNLEGITGKFQYGETGEREGCYGTLVRFEDEKFEPVPLPAP